MARRTVLPSGVRYSGRLVEPILTPAGESRENDNLVAYEREFRLCLLMDAYGIKEGDPNAWQKLAIRLATDHVRGMQVVTSSNTPGRKARWPAGLGRMLIEAVADQRKAKGIGIREAITNLSRDKNSRFYRMHVDSLVARHNEARRSAKRQSNSAKMPPGCLRLFDLVLGSHGSIKKADLKKRFGSISFGAFTRRYAKKETD
jgi:hypothetical protein